MNGTPTNHQINKFQYVLKSCTKEFDPKKNEPLNKPTPTNKILISNHNAHNPVNTTIKTNNVQIAPFK